MITLPAPSSDVFKGLLKSSKERELSTTMAFVRLLSNLIKDEGVGRHIVPIIPDEARTFGMEGLFRQLGIYAPSGQLYEPQDSETISWYKEDPRGQILEEGITEAGSLSSWMAAATAHVNYGVPMIPFYAFYSMFGFQRVGDQFWAAGDSRAKGFVLGATAGRTTLNGEGLQHQDGQGLLFASAYPTCRAYDPTFSYEVAVLIRKGIEQMFEKGEDVYYYITLQNENYPHPEMPEGVEEGISRGMYLFQKGKSEGNKVQLMGSGTIFREVIAAADLLENDFGVSADVWSILGVNQLHREGIIAEAWNRNHPEQPRKKNYVEEQLERHEGPVVISTDYVQAYCEQLRRFIHRPLTILGTDGYGRSDFREVLRSFFQVDRYHIVIAALKGLADEGKLPKSTVSEALKKYEIDPEEPHALNR